MRRTLSGLSLLCLWLPLTLLPLAAQPMEVDPAFTPELINDLPASDGLEFAPLGGDRLLVRGTFTHVNGAPAARVTRLLADGTVDPTFATGFPRPVSRAAPLADGRILAVTSNATDGTAQLERFLADGSPDTAFSALGLPNNFISRLIVQTDGRVLVVGYFSSIGSLARSILARLNADGTPDPTFDAGTPLDYSLLNGAGGAAIAVQPDGKVLYNRVVPISGITAPSYTLTRLLADGSPDTSFHAGTSASGDTSSVFLPSAPYHALAVQPTGRIVAATGDQLLRFLPTGDIDRSFTPVIAGLRRIDQIVPLANGRLIVQARVSPAAPPENNSAVVPSSVLVLDSSGAIVRDFRPDLPAAVSIELLAVPSEQQIVVRYGLPYLGQEPLAAPPPVIDLTPVPPPTLIPLARSTGAVAPAGFVSLVPVIKLLDPTVARLDLAGVRDPAFAPLFTARSSPSVGKLTADSAGRLLASGNFSAVGGAPRAHLARFLPDGSLDPTFLPPVRAHQWSEIALVQPDNKVVLLASALGAPNADGVSPSITTCERLRADGSIDPDFNTGALPLNVTVHALEADGRLLLSAFEPDDLHEANLKLFRLNPNGSRAATLTTTFADFRLTYVYTAEGGFTHGLANQIQAVQPQPDGKLLIAVWATTINGVRAPGIVRLNSDGTTDPSYHPAVVWPDTWYEPFVSFLSDGQALYTDHHPSNEPTGTTVRLADDGDRDPTFTPPPNTPIHPVMQLADGRLLSTYGTQRWLASGQPDRNYPRVLASTATEVGGKIYLAGNAVSVNGQAQNILIRLVPAETTTFSLQPQKQTVTAGQTAVFETAFGTSTATFQWTFNGGALSGATEPTLVLPQVLPSQAGEYSLVATVGGKTYTSEPATLTVERNTARLVNFSARCVVSPHSPPQIGGFVLRSALPHRVLLRSIGRGLPIDNPGFTLLPEPTLSVHRGSALIAQDNGGALASAIAGLSRQVGAFPPRAVFPPNDPTRDSALVLDLPADAYTAQTISRDGQAGLSLFEFYDADTANEANAAANVSIRGRTAPGDDALIAGFVIRGEGQLRLLIRGIGPGLGALGVASPLADPRITLYRDNTVLAANDNWGDPLGATELAAAAQRSGAFPLPDNSRDAAVLVPLDAGTYSVHGAATDGSTGEMLIELYVVEN